jgi:hypothetical protein
VAQRVFQNRRQTGKIAALLDHVVFEAEPQGGGDHVLVALAGDQHDRQVEAALIAHRLGDVERVQRRQLIVEQQQVVAESFVGVLGQMRQGLLATVHDVEAEKRRVLGKMALGEVDIETVVLGVEDAHEPPLARGAGAKTIERRRQNARQLLAIVAVLAQVIVCPGLQRSQRRRLVTGTGEHDKGQRQPLPAHMREQIEAAAVGKVEVGKNDVEVGGADFVEHAHEPPLARGADGADRAPPQLDAACSIGLPRPSQSAPTVVTGCAAGQRPCPRTCRGSASARTIVGGADLQPCARRSDAERFAPSVSGALRASARRPRSASLAVVFEIENAAQPIERLCCLDAFIRQPSAAAC